MLVHRTTVLLATLLLVVGSVVYVHSVVVPNNSARLTPKGSPYETRTLGTQVTIRNNGSGGNNREIYWDEAMSDSSVATMCATWVSGNGIGQHGFAFRIARRQDGGYNAIVFTRNIWAHAYWVFNVAMFYTGDEYDAEAHIDDSLVAKPYDGPWGVDLSEYLGMTTRMVYPLRVCASLDEHDVLRFAVAKVGDRMPSLNNPGNQGGQWELNLDKYYHAGQGLSGKHGIYAGHVPFGTSLTYDKLEITHRSAN